MKRAISGDHNGVRYFGHEDGKAYRGVRVNLDATKRHVKYVHDKVNSAPVTGNRSEMHYLGSVDMNVLVGWLRQHNYTMNDFAIQQDVKAEFMAYYKINFAHMMAENYGGAKAKPQIIVPGGITNGDNKVQRAEGSRIQLA